MLVDSRSGLLITLALLAGVLTGCSNGVGFDAGDAGPALDVVDVSHMREAGVDVLLLGHVCTTSADCNDGIACTMDVCGSDNRCLNLPNAAMCDNGMYCDGQEICDLHRGCINGPSVSCDDNAICTADRCVEATHSCVHTPLDRDHDGDPDEHCSSPDCSDAGVPLVDGGVCWFGHDCNDLDPRVNSLVPELCGDGIDNNCNGYIDDAEPGGCTHAPNDLCSDPLNITAGGVFTLNMATARANYALSCGAGLAHVMTTVLHLTSPQDIDFNGSSPTSSVSMALQSTCGSMTPSDTIACSNAYPALLRRHSLPAGDYYVLVGASSSDPVTLTVRLSMPTPAPTNDTCARAQAIPTTNGAYMSDLIGVASSVSTTCGGAQPNAIYTFTLGAAQDVSLQVAATHGEYLSVSLTSDCVAIPTTLRCDSGSPVLFTAHQLAAGTYFIVVQSADPVAFTLETTFGPPTPPAPGDVCSNALTLAPGIPVMVASVDMENDYMLTCGSSGRDTVFQFSLTTRSDVVVSVSGGTGDYFAADLANACPPMATTDRSCLTGNTPQPYALGLDPGTYYVITKPFHDTDYQVTLNTYPPITAMPASGNATCATAQAIPAARTYYTGTTTGTSGIYDSPCAGTTPGPDAVFLFHLPSAKHVTVAVNATFLNSAWIAQAGSCPGSATTGTGQLCNLGTLTNLDAMLPAGDYYLFVAGLTSTSAGSYGVLVQVSP